MARGLATLNLGLNRLTSLSCLGSRLDGNSLRVLVLRANAITSLRGISAAPRLASLDVAQNAIAGLGEMRSLWTVPGPFPMRPPCSPHMTHTGVSAGI